MPVSKAALLVAALLLSAAVAGGAIAFAVRPAEKPVPQAAAAAPAIQPQQVLPPPNCSLCTYPPPTSVCIPKGLSFTCERCYVADLNAAKLIPYPVVYIDGRWKYKALQGTNANGTPYGYLWVDMISCP